MVIDLKYLVLEIHNYVVLVLGINNIIELEDIINSRESCFSFLNRSRPFPPKEQAILQPREQRLIKIEVPFIDEISKLVILKMLDKKTCSTLGLKIKFVRNSATLDVTYGALYKH